MAIAAAYRYCPALTRSTCINLNPQFVQTTTPATTSTYLWPDTYSPCIDSGHPDDDDLSNADNRLWFADMGRWPGVDVVAPARVYLNSPADNSGTSTLRPYLQWYAANDSVAAAFWAPKFGRRWPARWY